MSNIIKFVYDDVKITIRVRYNNYYLDFIYKDKRIKRSTGLVANSKNLEELKLNIIPELIKALTGNKEIEYFKKDVLFTEFSTKFFEVYKCTVRDHVYKRNLLHYNNHIYSYFKDYLINEIKPLILEDWQNKLLLNYKASSVTKYRSILYSILEKAFINDVIKFNPMSKVKSPLTIKSKFKKLNDVEDEEIYPFNKDEIINILNSTTGNLYYFIVIMLYTGMRPGEIISLTWKDIDFDKKRIAVDKTTVNGKIGNVKTQSSVRYVDIIPILEYELKNLYKDSPNNEYLLLSSHNKPFYSHDIIAKRFKELLLNISIKERKLYNLRHTFASTMITQGQNILWVSRMLGHKDVSITLKVYARFIKENDEERLDKLSKIVPFFVPFINK
ncbi:tyrosine-type recombinase/integrase [Aliarcobacter cryaerophilus]|uniref:tyrosine-type recombinase/integrase n=1 Tax=Aliarcobacter cryaerophilus TaxID=28198 RepID=UPI000EB38CC5|nr:tyrosine-type recombinase/integrase [Aliarcobacter cryaerophilus]AYJ78176.1 site-specific tyrosine recombinase, phage integrase family (INT_ICEBs1_C_like domain) [Aliarcobacter cryaerophilus D2610]